MSWDYIADLKQRIKLATNKDERKRLQQFLSDAERDPDMAKRTEL